VEKAARRLDHITEKCPGWNEKKNIKNRDFG